MQRYIKTFLVHSLRIPLDPFLILLILLPRAPLISSAVWIQTDDSLQDYNACDEASVLELRDLAVYMKLRRIYKK
ncbi:hypothetical protein DFH27DRAFT_530303 [Peziza echinospora]|nr:hypothetical protein DFH27DRAFT_530303 [Peziza echinospora]